VHIATILNPGHTQLIALTLLLTLVRELRYINRVVATQPSLYIHRHRNAGTFSDAQLYAFRITSRAHIPRLMDAMFRNPNYNPIMRWECDNGTVEDLEVGFMMFLYWNALPRTLFAMQEIFGREYSQISKILKAVWNYFNSTWGWLVTNNLAYHARRGAHNNAHFIALYLKKHGHLPAPRFLKVAWWMDGHKVAINRDLRIYFSGHKWFYCLSFLIVSSMEGLVCECWGAEVGCRNDHHLQNSSNISHRLLMAQQGQADFFTCGTDKGLHISAAVKPMYNNQPNTPNENLANHELSACRATSEWDVGRQHIMWKFIDYKKVLFRELQPLGLMFRVLCILTNAITCLDGNSTSEYYNICPPTLEDYFS
jgi:hypothetical protein